MQDYSSAARRISPSVMACRAEMPRLNQGTGLRASNVADTLISVVSLYRTCMGSSTLPIWKAAGAGSSEATVGMLAMESRRSAAKHTAGDAVRPESSATGALVQMKYTIDHAMPIFTAYASSNDDPAAHSALDLPRSK